MRDKRCETCAAWDPGTPEEESEVGHCRRMSPRIGLDDGAFPAAVWPMTGDDDWCLEWLPKTPEPGEC